MKTITKGIVLLLSMLMLSGVFLFSANAATFPSLPSTPVTVTVTSAANVYPLTVVLSGVPAGFDVTNGAYVGWCFSLLEVIHTNVAVNPVTLTSSFTDSDKINYLLNNQDGGTSHDVQAAIWIIQGFTAAQILAHAGFSPSATAIALAAAANANGVGFVPNPGQIIAVEGIAPTGTQDVLIQLTVPGQGPGLTPGFWKNNLAVFLGVANGNRGYSDSGSPIVNAVGMQAWLASLTPTQLGGQTLLQLYTIMSTGGNANGAAAARQNAANILNALAGLSTTVIV